MKKKYPVSIAAVEGGGTSFVVAIAELSSPNDSIPRIIYRSEIDSSHDDPNRTLGECATFLKKHKDAVGGYQALGVAMFGPVGVDPRCKENYGRILSSTPKKFWRNVDILSPLIEACQDNKTTTGEVRKLAVRIDTDVNAPAFAEYISESQQKMNVQKISSLAYVTVGTG